MSLSSSRKSTPAISRSVSSDWKSYDIPRLLLRMVNNSDSQFVPNLNNEGFTFDQIRNLVLYRDTRRLRFTIKWFDNQLYLQASSHCRETGVGSFARCGGRWNIKATGDVDAEGPLHDTRRGLIIGRNLLCEPDASMQMEGRHSRNVVFEVARSQTTPSLINLLKSYIRDTDDIMVAGGVKIYGPNNHAQLSMVFIMLIRNNQNQPELAHCISFGPAPHGFLSPRARAVITNALSAEPTPIPNPQITGYVNAGAIPCTLMSQAAYTINIPGELLFCMNENFIIPAELHLQNTQGPFPLNLYHLQQAIFRGYQEDVENGIIFEVPND